VVGSRLPDELWAAAVEMVGICGLNRTVKTLKLDYYALKRRVEGSHKKRGERQAAHTGDSKKRVERRAGGIVSGTVDRAKSGDLQKSGGVRFLELATSSGMGVSAGGCECCVEWEDATGSKMRVHLKGTVMPDLAALSRSFWNQESAS